MSFLEGRNAGRESLSRGGISEFTDTDNSLRADARLSPFKVIPSRSREKDLNNFLWFS